METDGFHSLIIVDKIIFLIHTKVTMMSELFFSWSLSILFLGWTDQIIFTYMRWKTREMFNENNFGFDLLNLKNEKKH